MTDTNAAQYFADGVQFGLIIAIVAVIVLAAVLWLIDHAFDWLMARKFGEIWTEYKRNKLNDK